MNDHPTDACTNGTNPLQDFPQLSSAPPQSPWLDGTSIATQPLPTATNNGAGALLPASLGLGLSFAALHAVFPLL